MSQFILVYYIAVLFPCLNTNPTSSASLFGVSIIERPKVSRLQLIYLFNMQIGFHRGVFVKGSSVRKSSIHCSLRNCLNCKASEVVFRGLEGL